MTLFIDKQDELDRINIQGTLYSKNTKSTNEKGGLKKFIIHLASAVTSIGENEEKSTLKKSKKNYYSFDENTLTLDMSKEKQIEFANKILTSKLPNLNKLSILN